MTFPRQRNLNILFLWLAAVPALFIALGCSRGGPKTVPVVGQIKLAGGDNGVLAGHTLEIALDSDQLVRAAGEIQSDGSFTLQAIQNGAALSGVFPGTYQARIVLGDDDTARKQLAAKTIHPRHLQFAQSGLALRIPADQPIALEIKRR